MTTTAPRIWPGLEDVVGDIRAILDRAEHVVCLAHKDADADSLGSALGFAAAVRAMGKTAHPVVPEPEPYLLSFLPGYERLESAPERVDVVFAFDCATLQRFGEKRVLLESGYPVVNVDHHVSNDGFGTVNLVEPRASATGQVVYRLLRALGAPVGRETADNLYAALLTDTGGFRHENTTEEALRLAADLVVCGADPAWVALRSYKSRPLTQVRLEALSVGTLRAERGGELIWSEVTRSMLHDAGARMQESDGIIDELQAIDTMKIAILFKEMGAGVTKVSVRTRNPVDATSVCAPFGGGGHSRAAGAELRCTMPEAEAQVLAVAGAVLDGLPGGADGPLGRGVEGRP